MADQEFTRPREGFRCIFHGMKTNSAPDAMPPDKYPLAVNVRAITEHSVTTRSGQAQRFSTGGSPLTDIGSYVGLNTDGLPRILARDTADRIYLDTGVLVGTLAGSGASPGATLIPFRPAASPTPWMYIANGTDYQKFSSPHPTPVQQKVGISEPQVPPDAGVIAPQINTLGDPNTPAGTAGVSATSNRTNDTIAAVFLWNLPLTNTYSLQTGTSQYQRFQFITINSANPAIVEDVFQQFIGSLTIEGIFYAGGSVGPCTVVPANVGSGPGNDEQSVFTASLFTALRRGALVKIGTEVCMVHSVSTGPDGTISFETITSNPHTTADLLSSVPSIQIVMLSSAIPSPGQTIVAGQRTYQVTTGIGTVSAAFPGYSLALSFQPDDYICVAFNIDNLTNLNEIKVLIDVGDGSFTQNFYYYTVRPSDIVAGLNNSLTQLAVAQIVTQHAIIDSEDAIAANNQGSTASSVQLFPGSAQWSQIIFPISALTRVGDDQTRTLQQITGVQYLFNASGTINVKHGTQDFYVFGASQPDVGDIGAPYQYRVRPRSSTTGVVGNPSPATRYGVNPRRQSVLINLPTTADSQIDTWDIFRYGGTITSWRFVGQAPASTIPFQTFTDNFSDDAVAAGDALDFDNFAPWPTVDVPNLGTASIVCGTQALFQSANTNMANYLPGTLVRLGGQNVYTLWTRPVFISGTTYLIQFVENAGAGTNVPFIIQEPSLASAALPYMWGPDAAGTIFACGDPLRPGTLSFAKNYAPDSVPDTYNIEVSPPTEPLLGGEVLDGLSFVASTERWWALYPQQNAAQRYSIVQQPLPRGLAAPFGHCTDGVAIYWWAKDGIYSSATGSLTDADLYNLFPHEGVPGVTQVYLNYLNTTLPAPDYSRAGTFRLACANGYLYATYTNAGVGGASSWTTLIYDIRHKAWSLDRYSPQVTSFYHPEQQAGTLKSSAMRYDELLMTTADGRVAAQSSLTNDLASPIPCILASFEYDGQDVRAGEQWGDLYLDSTPAAQGAGGPLTLTPMFKSAPAAPSTIIPASLNRAMQPVSIGGELLTDFLGILLTWTDDFTLQAASTAIHIWQPSYLPKPETIADRFTDWEDAGIEGEKWIQGFVLHADTFNVVKSLAVRDDDTQTTHPFTPTVQHNGESERAYSFNTPFFAHLVRIEPQDQIPWRLFNIRWIAEPTPEFAETWQTQVSVHGLQGYMHARQISLAYLASAPVTLTVTVYDGTAPSPITFPPTSGAVAKVVVPFTFNKGQLYTYKFTSPAPFQVYQEQSEVLIGGWSRESGYANVPLVGAASGDKARI